ncbi:MAG: nicotinamide mononucleotide transporter family protein [Candidatus Cardinium sp.]|uniref:nicotinamide mononucleotide transporter family protein n=1 Tax=Cardinium endosymbiont of Dermatophagoides farinae TaxID=2597823 RepID=UPI0011821520|nr:nicotinamide mononucleotide transporter family protein [Cardinium endosymbiont of Dermatophagoides farinae]TSJ81305.1 nicotinamide mononucleotide transporter [Cardinium endosymbiont of Dermatophagoides farinae]UWW97368.1 MAG: nicotinamide mononucleotide transporter family protein [Candidatus Cardinium sp.]
MTKDQLFTAIIGAGKWLIHDQQSLLEFSVVIASILAHVLEARQNIWSKILAFPIAFTNIYVYSVRQLYGKVIYSIIFIFFNLYAYLRWKGSIRRKPVEVSRTSHKMLLSITGMSMLGGMGCHLIIGKYLHAASYGDAYYLSFGFMDKWLMSHKKLERWTIALFRHIAFSLACYQIGAIMLCIHHLILSCIGIYGQIKWYTSYKGNLP